MGKMLPPQKNKQKKNHHYHKTNKQKTPPPSPKNSSKEARSLQTPRRLQNLVLEAQVKHLTQTENCFNSPSFSPHDSMRKWRRLWWGKQESPKKHGTWSVNWKWRQLNLRGDLQRMLKLLGKGLRDAQLRKRPPKAEKVWQPLLRPFCWLNRQWQPKGQKK